MTVTKTCAICGKEYYVSRFDRQDPYVCKDCAKWLKTRKGKTVTRNKNNRGVYG